MKDRVNKYGNKRNSKFESYDKRVDVPILGDNIFYLSRGYRTRDDLHESIKNYKKFGYSQAIENSEV